MKNVISPLSQVLWTTNLASWCLSSWKDLIQKATWHIDNVVTGQIKNVLSPHSQVHGPKNLVGYWLRMRRARPKNHETLWSHSHMKSQTRHISGGGVVISSLSHGSCSLALAKDGLTSLKNLQITWHYRHLTSWKRYA